MSSVLDGQKGCSLWVKHIHCKPHVSSRLPSFRSLNLLNTHTLPWFVCLVIQSFEGFQNGFTVSAQETHHTRLITCRLTCDWGRVGEVVIQWAINRSSHFQGSHKCVQWGEVLWLNGSWEEMRISGEIRNWKVLSASI